jgi:hypothetical protein
MHIWAIRLLVPHSHFKVGFHISRSVLHIVSSEPTSYEVGIAHMKDIHRLAILSESRALVGSHISSYLFTLVQL